MNNDNTYIPKEKNSFVMYKSWNKLFLTMSDDSAGKLIKAICLYQDGEQPTLDDPIANAVLSMFIDIFRHDSEKYAEKCLKNSNNGKKGGRGRRCPPQRATESDRFQMQANKADNDTDTDNDNDTEKEKDTDTDTDIGSRARAPSSASASVFFSESDEDFSAFRDFCRKENIKASGDQIERYLHEMNKKGWTDRSGKKIKNIGGHFRDWLKRNPDETNDYVISEDLYHALFEADAYLFRGLIDKLFNHDGIVVCMAEAGSGVSFHEPEEFISMLISHGFTEEASQIKKIINDIQVKENGKIDNCTDNSDEMLINAVTELLNHVESFTGSDTDLLAVMQHYGININLNQISHVNQNVTQTLYDNKINAERVKWDGNEKWIIEKQIPDELAKEWGWLDE